MRTDLPDVNVLVALFVPNHQHHEPAQRWLTDTEQFATTPMTEAGLVRVLMSGLPGQAGISGQSALSRLRELRAHERWTFWPDGTSLADQRAVTGHLQGPKQVTDTHLLNLAMAQGSRLATFDGGIGAPLDRQTRRYLNELR